jgi:uncharacterized membrane protein
VDSGGAFLLFLTNFFAILLAGAIVFRLMGLERLGFVDGNQDTKRRVVRVIIAGTLLITLLLAGTTYNVWVKTSEQTGTADAVKDWLGDTSFQVVDIKIRPSEVDITIRGDDPVPPLKNLHTRLNALYGRPAKINLHVIPYASQSYPS